GRLLALHHAVLVAERDADGPVRHQLDQLAAGVELQQKELVARLRLSDKGQVVDLVRRDRAGTAEQVERNAAIHGVGRAGAAAERAVVVEARAQGGLEIKDKKIALLL